MNYSIPPRSDSSDTFDEDQAVRLAEMFRSLGDATRLRIISRLLEGEQSVQALAAALGLSPSAVSHQLRTMRQLKLVRFRKSGRFVYYALDDEHIRDLFLNGLGHVRHR